MSEVKSVSNLYSAQFGAAVYAHSDGAQLTVTDESDECVALKPIQIGIRIGEIFTSRVEALEKVTKNTGRLIELCSKLKLVVSASLDNLAVNLKTVVDLFDSIRFVAMLNLFFCPQKNGRYFLTDKKNSIYKKVDRLFLAGHLVCKTSRVLNKWHLIDLGKVAKAKIGNFLTVFQVVADGLMTTSCVFNIVDTVQRLNICDEQETKQAEKIKRWENRPGLLERVLAGDQSEKKHLEKLWTVKIEKNQKKLEEAQEDVKFYPSHKNKKIVEKLEQSIHKLKGRLELLADNNYQALHADMSKAKPAEKLKQLHLDREKIKEERCLSWIKIAASVSKIFVIAMAVTFTAFNLTAVLPVVALLACGIISDSLGLTKIVIEQFNKEKEKA